MLAVAFRRFLDGTPTDAASNVECGSSKLDAIQTPKKWLSTPWATQKSFQ